MRAIDPDSKSYFVAPGSRTEGVAISLWDKKEDAEAYLGSYPEVLKALAKVVDGTPEVRECEVAHHDFVLQICARNFGDEVGAHGVVIGETHGDVHFKLNGDLRCQVGNRFVTPEHFGVPVDCPRVEGEQPNLLHHFQA